MVKAEGNLKYLQMSKNYIIMKIDKKLDSVLERHLLLHNERH